MSNTLVSPPELIKRGKFVDYRQQIWGDSFTWSWERPLSQVQYLVIHHTVTKHEATPDDIALLHKARGWAGIGYHFVITKDGTVYYVGDIGTARANVANMNEKIIGISLIGDFTKHLPSDEQILSTHDLCKYFIENYPALTNVTDWGQSHFVGHKDLDATACPGDSWPNDMRDRIKNRIPYTPQPAPVPTDPCDAEKKQIVQIQKEKEEVEKQKSAIEVQANADRIAKEEAERKLTESQKLVTDHEKMIEQLKKQLGEVQHNEDAEEIKEQLKEVTELLSIETKVCDKLGWYVKGWEEAGFGSLLSKALKRWGKAPEQKPIDHYVNLAREEVNSEL